MISLPFSFALEEIETEIDSCLKHIRDSFVACSCSFMIMAGILQENFLSPRNSEIKNLNELNSKSNGFVLILAFYSPRVVHLNTKT